MWGDVNLFKDKYKKSIESVYYKFKDCAWNVSQAYVLKSSVSDIVDIKVLLTDVVGE